ncbi:MAG: hypothetical protein ABL940_01640 [Bacteroidia bacterium]
MNVSLLTLFLLFIAPSVKAKNIAFTDSSVVKKMPVIEFPNSLVKQNYTTNVLKISPTLFLRNIAALSYVHTFTPTFGVVGSLGICYGKDNLFGKVNVFATTYFQNLYSTNFPLELYNKSKFYAPTGYMYIAPKFIFKSIKPNKGSYVELGYTRYNNSTAYVPTNTYGNNVSFKYVTFSGSRKLKFIYETFAVKFGYQWWLSKNKVSLTNEVFFNIGIQTLNFTNIVQTYNIASINMQGPSYNYIQTTFSGYDRAYAPVINVGYSFGIGLTKKTTSNLK